MVGGGGVVFLLWTTHTHTNARTQSHTEGGGRAILGSLLLRNKGNRTATARTLRGCYYTVPRIPRCGFARTHARCCTGLR
uniref:Putative secreted protein n=1 Tax=Anopheles triannulatus TaxID=58253 RepID=A0A2M4B6G2_9DIPT